MRHFGPFSIDERTWSLTRGTEAIRLSPRLVEILAFLASRSGDIVTKDELLARFWPDVNIAENTLARAVADIRRAIGERAGKPSFVQTLARRGYRFIGDPSAEHRLPDGNRGDVFAAWVNGKQALESLDVARLPGAIAAFERAAAALPSYAPAHAGLANAYLLQFETTRSRTVPDRDLLAQAIAAARRACAADSSLGEGWATLGYSLAAAGKSEEAQAAARRAAALEPENWRHQYRLAYATWGEERLRAVDRTLTLLPGCAPARMLSTMVFIARGAIDRAEREAREGAEAQRRQRSDQTPLAAAGLHWVRGLVMGARGDAAAALASFREEIATTASGHIYAREFAMNARIATGFTQINCGDWRAAASTFHQVLDETAGHPRALVGLCAVLMHTGEILESDRMGAAADGVITELIGGGRPVEAALVSAGLRVVRGRPIEAIEILQQLLADAPPGPAGWIIPVDPMLTAVRFLPGGTGLLATLAARAA